MISWETILLLSLITLAASIISGTCGFGFSLVSLPFMIMLVSPRTLIPAIVMMTLFMNAGILLSAHMHLELKRIKPLMLAGVLGIPIGTLILLYADVFMLKLMIGVLITIIGALFLAGFKRPLSKEGHGLTVVGFVSGVLQGSVSISGPPVILFFSNQDMPKDPFRANIVSYFLLLNLVGTFVYLASGLLTVEATLLGISLLPALALGTGTGILLSKKVDEKLFRKIALVLVICGGLAAVLSSVGMV